MILKKAFQKTIEVIKKHKWLFLILFFCQLGFIIVLSVINVRYQLAIFENMQSIIGPLQEGDVTSGFGLMEDPLEVYQNYRAMMVNINYLLFFSLLAFLVLNGLNWAVTNYLFEKKNLLKLYRNFVIVALAFIIPVSLIVSGILGAVFSQEQETLKASLIVAGIIIIVAAYFMVIGFSLLDKKIKNIFKKGFWIGVKKVHWVLLTHVINFIILGILGTGLYFSVEANFWLMILAIILFILAWVGVRIFFVGVVKELDKRIG